MDNYENKFEVCARAVIKYQGGILLCRHKEHKDYFFPGGHIELSEKAEEALIRELKEELNISIKKCLFIGTAENFYFHDGRKHHEINLVFSVSVNKVSDKSLEDHLEFVLMDRKRFIREKILPVALKKAVIKWFKNKKIFWASQN
jgi:8-oxo-dGTP pyrophosphatase MutT (NUDIX family)